MFISTLNKLLSAVNHCQTFGGKKSWLREDIDVLFEDVPLEYKDLYIQLVNAIIDELEEGI